MVVEKIDCVSQCSRNAGPCWLPMAGQLAAGAAQRMCTDAATGQYRSRGACFRL